jgi:THO complex subunit 2
MERKKFIQKKKIPKSEKSSSNDTSESPAEDTFDPLVFESPLCKELISIITEILLPSLTLGATNCFTSFELWNVMKCLPFQIRFACYDKWYGAGLGKDGVGEKLCEVSMTETKVSHAAKACLKRLSKENCKSMWRQLDTCSQNSPLTIHNLILGQIEAYDNMIPIIVDAIRRQTPLSLDVMAYCIVHYLERSGKNSKLKEGDTHYSQWFSSLARFTAILYGSSPSIELKGLFHYLLNQLSKGESLDLLLLKELLCKMGGCDSMTEVSGPFDLCCSLSDC